MFKFKNLFIPTGQKESVVAYESWTVRWTSRYGEYSGNTQQEAEVFTNEDDAKKFANQLREAFKLTRTTSGNRVIVTKN
jgi:hypothetical protein